MQTNFYLYTLIIDMYHVPYILHAHAYVLIIYNRGGCICIHTTKQASAQRDTWTEVTENKRTNAFPQILDERRSATNPLGFVPVSAFTCARTRGDRGMKPRSSFRLRFCIQNQAVICGVLKESGSNSHFMIKESGKGRVLFDRCLTGFERCY